MKWRALLMAASGVVCLAMPASAANSSTRFDWTGVVGDMQASSSTFTLYVGGVAQNILWTPTTQVTGGTLAQLTPGSIVEVPGIFTSSANVASSIRIFREESDAAKARLTTTQGAIFKVSSNGQWGSMWTSLGRVDVTVSLPSGTALPLVLGQIISVHGVMAGTALSVSDETTLPTPAPVRLRSRPTGLKSAVVGIVVGGQRDLWQLWTTSGLVSVTVDAGTSVSPTLAPGTKVKAIGVATGSQFWATSVTTPTLEN